MATIIHRLHDFGVSRVRLIAFAACVFVAAESSEGADQDPQSARSATSQSPQGVSVETDKRAEWQMLMPLTIGLTLNAKYVGQIDVKIDPKTNDGVFDQTRFLNMMKPLLGRATHTKMRSAFEDKQTYIPFSTLNDVGLSIEFDQLSLSLAVTSGADSLSTQDLALKRRSTEPNPSLYQSPSVFTAGVNVTASQRFEHRDTAGETQRPQWVLNGLVNVGGFEGVTIEGGARHSGRRDGKWERSNIIASKDFFDSALRLTAGEITPRTQSFQGAQRVLGVGLYRSYSNIRPFQIVRPTGRRQFNLEEESKVDVYVNEILVETIELEKGSYSLSDFPITSRANDVRLEINGRSGRNQVLEFDVYGGSELLAPGISDFGFFLGNRQGAAEFDYSGGAALTGYYRKGLTGQLSAGATLQATEQAQQLGLLLTYGNRYGLFDMEAATSYQDRDAATGSAYRLNYRNTFSLIAENDLRISANGEYRTQRFQGAFDDLEFAPQKWSSALQASWIGPKGWSATLGLTAAERRGLNGGVSSAFNAALSRRMGNFQFGGSFAMGENASGERSERIGFTLGYRPLGAFSSTAQYNSAEHQMQLDLSHRPRQRLEALNLSAQIQDSDRGRRYRANMTYNHNRFESSIQHNHIETSQVGLQGSQTDVQSRTDIRLSSFIGLSNGAIGVGRPVQSGFVLANKHRSLKDSVVEIKNGQQLVARPGFLGAAVIPITRPYAVNKFDISVEPLPLGYDLGDGSITVFPGHGSSYKAPIGSDASRTAMGFLLQNGEPMALISGVVSPIGILKDIEKWQRPLFTNRAGRFVADRLRPGEYEIIVAEKVVATFKIEKMSEGMVNVGRLGGE